MSIGQATGAELLGEGRRRYEAGDFADAEPLAHRALELRSPDGPAAPRAEALQLVAEIEFSLGRYPAAQRVAEEARRLRDGAAPEVIAETDNLLGIIILARGDVAAALPVLEGARAARQAALGPDDSDTIESLNNVAAAVARDGRVDEAIAMNREALARCERAFGEPHRQLAVSLNALAVKLDRTDATRPEAGALYDRALEAAEAALGPEHPMVATLLANLATQRMNSGDPEGARPFVARSIDLHERRHGPDHPGTATALLNAAELARHDGDLETARAVLERVLSIRLAAFGPADTRTRQIVARLLTVMSGLNATDPTIVRDGILVLEVHRALKPDPDVVIPPRPDPAVVERLHAYLDRRLALAVPLDDEARRGLDRVRMATVAADAALVGGALDAARVALDDAIAGTVAVRGSDDLGLVELLHRRAAVARAGDRQDEAIRDDERALAILGAAYGDRHPYVLRARTRLAHELELEFGPGAARPVLVELRMLLEDQPAEGMGRKLRDRLDQYLRRIPLDAVPEPIGRSARRREALAEVGPRAARLLPDLDRVDWAALAHARGPATDVPANLRLLASDDRAVVEDALNRLVDTLLNRGTVAPAAPAVVAPLLALAGDPGVPHRAAAIELLAAILANTGLRAGAVGTDDVIVRAILARFPEATALLDRLARDPDLTVRTTAIEATGLLARIRVTTERGRRN